MSSEEESEVAKVAREDKQRKEIINIAMNELFQLKLDEEREDEISEEDSFEQRETIPSHPPGVKFFSGDVNCIYNQDSITCLLNMPFCNNEHIDVTSLHDIERTIQHKYVIESLIARKLIFKSFYKLLFTYQTREYLDTVSSILLELACKTNQTNALLQVALETLPLGIKNLGGQVTSKIVSQVEVDEIPDINESTVRAGDEAHMSIIDNIQYLVNILQYLFTKENSFAKGKLNISDASIDNLVFLFLVISQDPMVLRSNIVASIQNLIAFILDLYPDSADLPEQVLNIVGRMVCYWDDSPEEFNHHTACYLTCDVLPLSVRGKRLRESLAYCIIVCCLTPNVVDTMADVDMKTLAEFCSAHARELVDLDCYGYCSVVKLINAAIRRPFKIGVEGPYLLDLQETINVCSNKVSGGIQDYYYQAQLQATLLEIKDEWNRLLEESHDGIGHKRKLQ